MNTLPRIVLLLQRPFPPSRSLSLSLSLSFFLSSCFLPCSLLHICFVVSRTRGSESCSSDKRIRNVASSCAKCKGKGIEPSTRGDRDYKSKVKLPGTRGDTPPRRRFFQRILKVAASFFTRLRSPKTQDTYVRRKWGTSDRRKSRFGWTNFSLGD